MPHAEDGARDGGQRIGCEVECCQRRGQAGVLHAHLDADGLPLGGWQTQHSADGIPHRQTTNVMEHHHQNDDEAAGQQLRRVGGNHNEHNSADGKRRKGWKIGGDSSTSTPIYCEM